MGLADIIMPEWIRRGLRRAVMDRTLPHAYLFSGPAGVGKRAIAVALAKAVNCLTAAGDACDRCAVCQRIDRGLYPDVYLVEPQGQVIRIDQIRQLQASLMLQAYEGRCKVAILDAAEQLSTEAANSLLKILEEPPPATLFILLCHNLGGVPSTVMSRAQILRFGLLPRQHLIALLQQRRRPQADAERAAALSGGRPGWALTLDLPTMLDLRATALQLLSQAQSGDHAALLGSAEQWAKRKNEHGLLFDMLLSLTRDLAIAQAGGEETALIHGDLRPGLVALASAVPKAAWGPIFDIIHATHRAIAHNANPQLALEVMLLRIGDAYERPPQRDRNGYAGAL